MTILICNQTDDRAQLGSAPVESMGVKDVF
jgi:hypothetical protein